MFVEYIKNFVLYFVSINANAFWTIVDFLSQNWFLLISLVFVSVLAYTEIDIKSMYIINDKRNIY